MYGLNYEALVMMSLSMLMAILIYEGLSKPIHAIVFKLILCAALLFGLAEQAVNGYRIDIVLIVLIGILMYYYIRILIEHKRSASIRESTSTLHKRPGPKDNN